MLAYVIGHGDEAMTHDADLRLFTRSRMPGVLGLSYGASQLDELDMAHLREETELWKSLRGLQTDASALLLTEQVGGPSSPPWDVVLLLASSRDEGIIYAYQTDRDTYAVLVRLRGLDRAATYGVQSMRTGETTVASGAQLMDEGLEIAQADDTAAQLLRLSRVSGTQAARKP
jgi:hypothetical protein